MDFVFTVCDSAAAEECPYWPGTPATAHWGLPDPAAADGSLEDQRAAFREAYDVLYARIDAFVHASLDPGAPKEALRGQLTAIGKLGAADAGP
jgi:hypothetical protein